ncbi:MAG: DUF362 domain-containing protein [Desulfobacteraceae bacterium]|jgi:uncharacterized protein (DUF362 family)
MTQSIITIPFKSYALSIPKALNAIGADVILKRQTDILIKPNLVNSSPFPVTTPVDCCAALVDYIENCSRANIIIAEGCGDPSLETEDIFSILDYKKMAREKGVPLLDLNCAPLERKTNPHCTFFPEFYLPQVTTTHYIISVPVLKAHSYSKITGAMKNMMGFVPPKYYSGQYGFWKKALFHSDIHQAITELNRYRRPDLSVMDATVGLAEFHLGGIECDPPVNRILAGYDPQAVDRRAASLLGLDWRQIEHLTTPL